LVIAAGFYGVFRLARIPRAEQETEKTKTQRVGKRGAFSFELLASVARLEARLAGWSISPRLN
jgi:hypothetical protein